MCNIFLLTCEIFESIRQWLMSHFGVRLKSEVEFLTSKEGSCMEQVAGGRHVRGIFSNAATFLLTGVVTLFALVITTSMTTLQKRVYAACGSQCVGSGCGGQCPICINDGGSKYCS
jgi:hypothetical protein